MAAITSKLPNRERRTSVRSHDFPLTYRLQPVVVQFRYVAGLPEMTVASSLVFGGAIHRAVQYHFEQGRVGAASPSLETLLGEYEQAWQDYDVQEVHFGKDEQRQGLSSLAQRMLTVFQSSCWARPRGVIVGIEQELRGPIVPGCPDMLGRLDLLVETTDALVITDLKTARNRWSPDQVQESAGQLLLYHELARNLAPRKRLRLQFAVLTKAKQPALDLHEVPSEPQQLERAKRLVERVWRAIASEHFYPTPSPLQCPTCPYRAPCRAWPD
jgi:hypothetical protein